MADKENILKELEKLKNHKQFTVPEGYFNQLSGELRDRIKEEEENNSIQLEPKSPLFTLVKNQLAIAVSFAALFLISYTAIKFIVPESNNNSLSNNEIYASLQVDISELDEEYLFSLAYADAPETGDENVLTDQDIVNFLLEEGIELELTTIDF